jgi:hypothetical protein
MPAISVITPAAIAILVVQRIRMRVPFASARPLATPAASSPCAGSVPSAMVTKFAIKAAKARPVIRSLGASPLPRCP